MFKVADAIHKTNWLPVSVTAIIDSRLTMADHITAVCRSGYYQLCQLCCVVQSLTSEAAMTLVHSFVSTRLDYCNSVLYGIADNQLQRLQSVQNAAARLVTGTRRSEHITPVLRSLHWLPVRQRIVYKLATLIRKCLIGRAPAYLTEYWCQACICRPGTRSGSVLVPLEFISYSLTLEIGDKASECSAWSWTARWPRADT